MKCISRAVRTVTVISAALAVVIIHQNCSNVKFAVSPTEFRKLSEGVFDFDANARVAGITGADGNPSENLRAGSVAEAGRDFVKDCAKLVTLPDGSKIDRYEYEKENALKAAEDDVTGKTIPVAYALSFGQAEDRLAYWAHKRAVLSESNSGVTFIPVGPKNSSVLGASGKSFNAYYKANHAQAKADYIYGRKCFFNTVKVLGDMILEPRTTGGERYSFIQGETAAGTHMVHYMWYGWCNRNAVPSSCADETSAYGPGAYGKPYPNRLFAQLPHTENGRPQIVKLFVADLRDGHFGLSTATQKIVRVHEATERGAEALMNVKEQLDLKSIFRNRDFVIRRLSANYSGKSLDFAGMSGMPQLLANLQAAVREGTVIAGQYTPIVLDLGAEKVRTSSRFGGSFFNMAARAHVGRRGEEAWDFPHQTAWLGGELIDVLKIKPDPNGFRVEVVRRADDGFLVLPDSGGWVRSSRNLFGDQTVINGRTYANGFEALRALAGKNCALSSPKDRYVGPWDGDLYSKTLKVWVDRDRNGVAERDEIESLRNSGIVAINVCHIVHAESKDAFDNGTSLRSAFLYQRREDITGNESEILTRLTSGLKSDGTAAEFRLAVDLIFQVDEAFTLEP